MIGLGSDKNLYLGALQQYDDVILDETSWHKTCDMTCWNSAIDDTFKIYNFSAL